MGSNNPSPLTFHDTATTNGLEDCIKASYSSFSFNHHDGSVVQYLFDGCPLVTLDYRKACENIYSGIRFSSRITMIDRQATGFSQDNNILITLDNEDCIAGKILIDCSGKSQFTNSPDIAHARYYSHVYGAVFSGLPDMDGNIAYFLLPCEEFGIGGGWFYPFENNSASFGYATISSSSNFDITMLKNNFQKALSRFKPFSDHLSAARLESIECGTIPVTAVRNLVEGRIMRVGDAGGMATSWTCMGIEPSLRYGTLAGQMAVHAVTKNEYNSLKKFQETWDTMNKEKYDNFGAMAGTFWNGNHDFWEWIIRNDLAMLSPDQLIRRLRSNAHVPGKCRYFIRAAGHKIRTILNHRAAEPVHITVR